ncbi:hypothetical protein CPS_3067 [Colwellia psychrerythraea 34H]|uniref:Uncharacterized protein n=1 Tax=Colwellia psychrerythraea (strain 34H / ATCC BAA-681) TaxID=167879 RepID=Q47ZK5_COLP3|nr:hypothetical protein CPS_3067 [Colwellia psychrerythraea 34H]
MYFNLALNNIFELPNLGLLPTKIFGHNEIK